MAVEFICDLTEATTPLAHPWELSVGSCHAPLALRADWQAQLKRCHVELGFKYVRFHGLLSDDVGTLVSQGRKLIGSFYNADQIVDYLLSIGMRPFVELSFMPEALASGKATVFHYRANVTPPKDYAGWGMFIRKLIGHWVERYGADEVSQWFFEVWNEPNLKAFWTGTREQYFELYCRSVEVIKEIEGSLKVGGPATAQNAWIEEFLDFCAKRELPVDFVTTHHYPTDASGSESDDTETQLALSRRSILREEAQNARRRARGHPLYYTEWNTSSNPRDPRHDEPYAAAFVVKTAMEVSGLVDGYSFWTFSDIFEENYFPSMPFHGGFGLLSLHGVAKPTYRAFELLHRLGTHRLLVDGIHPTVDAWVVRRENAATVLLTNHALPRHPIQAQQVSVRLTGAPAPHAGHIERIDEDHANPKRAWLEMGKPEYLNTRDVEQLHSASRMARPPATWKYENGTVDLSVDLPPHAVAAITVEFAPGLAGLGGTLE